MERLTIIEHDAMHAMHPRCFDALTRGSCLERLMIWADAELLPKGPPRTLRLSAHPEVGESIVLAPEGDSDWSVAMRYRGNQMAWASVHQTFTTALNAFRARCAHDGQHWSEYEPVTRPGVEEPTVRAPHVHAWVDAVTTRLARLTQRQVTCDLGLTATRNALVHGDALAALATISGLMHQGDTLPLPVGLPSVLLNPLRELGQLLVAVEDEDPPSYVTALEQQARKVVAAAGLDLEVLRAEALTEPEGLRGDEADDLAA